MIWLWLARFIRAWRALWHFPSTQEVTRDQAMISDTEKCGVCGWNKHTLWAREFADGPLPPGDSGVRQQSKIACERTCERCGATVVVDSLVKFKPGTIATSGPRTDAEARKESYQRVFGH